MRKKRLIAAAAVVLLLGFACREKLVKTYVLVFHEPLEAYARNCLDNSSRSGSYGPWSVDIYHEDNMVEFMTGGSGLAPSSAYKGFYYSADNTHRVFSSADEALAPLVIDGDHATWTDGTDNHGSSTRLMENWFWFEASF